MSLEQSWIGFRNSEAPDFCWYIYIYMYMPTPRVSDRPFLPSTTSLWVNHIILPSFQKNLRNWGKFQSKYLRYEGSNSFRSCWARLVSLKELTENDAKSTNLLQLEIKSFKEIIHTYHIKSVCNFKNYHALKIRYPINHLGTPVPPKKKKTCGNCGNVARNPNDF